MTTNQWHQKAGALSFTIRNFIGGEYRKCVGKKTIQKFSPRDGSFLYEFLEGDGTEVDGAVVQARESFNDGRWSELSVHQRKAVILKLMDLVEEHKDELALLDCIDVGKPITNALSDDIPMAMRNLKNPADNADKLFSPCGKDGSDFGFQLRKPIGVVGAIIGWNYPLAMAVIKMAPALMMGNTLVLKPSEFSPQSAPRLAELAIEAGMPAGVFNVVQGAGATVGKAMADHQDIDLLTFTGSTATGKAVMSAAAESNMKRVMLECGGKSPFIVFDDCPDDLDCIADQIVGMTFRNQGQLCVASTRLLIQDSIKDRLLPKVIERAKDLKPADPLDTETKFAALINEAQINKVLGYIESGKKEGAKLVLGGERVSIDLQGSSGSGYYVPPTIFDEVDPNSTIAQEEIFGPVLSVITFKDEAKAIEIANNTCYGLAASAATQNLGRTQRLARKINSGYLTILGTSTFKPGGVAISSEPHRQSGFGAEQGMAGLESYTVITAVHLFT